MSKGNITYHFVHLERIKILIKGQRALLDVVATTMRKKKREKSCIRKLSTVIAMLMGDFTPNSICHSIQCAILSYNNARILFDSGSQRSYITNEVRYLLNV